MFRLTKFSGEVFVVNPDILKYLEEGGDTVVHLFGGERLLVRESVEEIQEMFMKYKKQIHQGLNISLAPASE